MTAIAIARASAAWRYAIRDESLRGAVTGRDQDAADRGTWTIVVIWHLLSGSRRCGGKVLNDLKRARLLHAKGKASNAGSHSAHDPSLAGSVRHIEEQSTGGVRVRNAYRCEDARRAAAL